MLDAAAHQFQLSQKIEGSDITRRQHLQGLMKQGADVGGELFGPDIPQTMQYLYNWFIECSSGRSVGMSGGNPLSWQDIQAYNHLLGRKLRKWEVRVIKKLDLLWIKYQ